MKEGFESYPVPQQTPAPIAEPWPHRMIQQQQQPGMLYNQTKDKPQVHDTCFHFAVSCMC